ncbi:MAG: multidrug transporter, partial [Spirochaetaceae bacterium]
MSKETPDTGLAAVLAGLSSMFSKDKSPVAIVLAAGQGKRIKSRRSKMLHTIWGVPTVVRVARAAAEGLQSPDQIIVVGIKAREVAETAGKLPGRKYALQAEQKGTGHAVKIALQSMAKENLDRDFYIIPGDMGLLDTATVRSFREAFQESRAEMMVMVGTYQGDPRDNYYGRILQVPEHDISGNPSGEDRGKIIQILEHRDILAIDPAIPYKTEFHGRTYSFQQQELLDIRFYNSGFYAFSGKHLSEHIDKLGYENVQGEMYLTDLIYLFNKSGLVV